MAELVKLLEKSNVCTTEQEDIDNIELIIKKYVQSGGTLKSNKINKILFLNSDVCNYMYIYEILLRYGYKFTNNLVALVILSNLYNVPLNNKTQNNTFFINNNYRLLKMYENDEIKKYLNLEKIIISEKDFNDYLKLNGCNIYEAIQNIVWYKPPTEKTFHKWPQVIFDVEKYKSEYNKYKN